MFVTLAIILLLVLFFIYNIVITLNTGPKQYTSSTGTQLVAFFTLPIILVDLTVDFIKYISS